MRLGQVIIHEIGPRDGFQNVEKFIDTNIKIQIIDRIIESGIKKIQFTSFMNPKAIPQLADSQIVARHCLEYYKDTGITFYALIANEKGADIAANCGVKQLSYVTSASETHNMANVRKTVDQSVAELAVIVQKYPDVKYICDVAMAFGCIFEGPLSDEHITRHIEKGVCLGVKTFTLCDSNGIATPDLVKHRLHLLMRQFPECTFRVHIHDTRNMGMLNTLTAIECGVKDVEVSICGLGGCPFSPGASGNTSTEDLVYMLNRMGYDTGVNFEKLLDAAKFAQENIEGNFSGHQINVTKNRRYQ